MNGEEQILNRLAAIEAKLEGLTAATEHLKKVGDIFENLQDLGRDVSLLTPPAVKLLTEELAEVETGFQLEDVTFLLKRFLLSLRNLAWGLEQMENLIDWWADMEPLMKVAVPHLIDTLEDLDQKGIFKGYQAMLSGYAKIAQAYSPADVDAIAEGFVRMHGMVKKFSDPKFIEFMEKLTEIPAQVDLAAASPTGPFGLLWRMRSPEMRQALGVMVELTRALGAVKPGPPPGPPGGSA